MIVITVMWKREILETHMGRFRLVSTGHDSTSGNWRVLVPFFFPSSSIHSQYISAFFLETNLKCDALFIKGASADRFLIRL